jgi:hypothetical protein
MKWYVISCSNGWRRARQLQSAGLYTPLPSLPFPSVKGPRASQTDLHPPVSAMTASIPSLVKDRSDNDHEMSGRGKQWESSWESHTTADEETVGRMISSVMGLCKPLCFGKWAWGTTVKEGREYFGRYRDTAIDW